MNLKNLEIKIFFIENLIYLISLNNYFYQRGSVLFLL
jgi:hypothetical protein